MSSETQQIQETQQSFQLQRSDSCVSPAGNLNMPQPQYETAESDDDMPALEMPYQPPTKPYCLVSTLRPLEEISDVTNNFQSISPEFMLVLMTRMSQRLWPTTYGSFKAPPYTESIKMSIGANGYFLKLTTQNCDVDLIWYDKKSEQFMFWGPSPYAVIQAMNHIRSRIVKYTVYIAAQPYRQQTSPTPAYIVEDISDDEEDDDDVPDLIDGDTGEIVN
jgi:hypothetical protein